MTRLRAAVPWLRWLALGAALLAMREPTRPVAPAVACSSGEHAWWVAPAEQGRWAVQHTERVGAGEPPSFHVAAAFEDEPVSLAAEGARVWVVFRGVGGRSEVMTGEAARNPASGLRFMRPAGLRLCASLPVAKVRSTAAHDGTLWALATDAPQAWRLRGERWDAVPLPTACDAASRLALASAGDDLWLVAAGADGSASRRWRRSGEAWESVALQTPPWSAIVTGAPRLAFQLADGSIGAVQHGAFVRACDQPGTGVPIGWGDGFAAIDADGDAPRLAQSEFGSAGFGAFVTLPAQRSVAVRWFHLPVLGVLSLGVVIAAVLVRGAAMVRGVPIVQGPEPMPLARRFAALAVDVAPAAGASLLAFDAELDRLLLPPLGSTDLSESLPFVTMAIGTVAFGALEEMVGGRSLGKRVFGGLVAREQGPAAEPWRHALRNLLKGLVMLSPVLALPVLVGRRRQGLPEAVTGTIVAKA